MTLKPTWLPDWLWAPSYDGNIIGVAIPDPGVYPTPIYEPVAAFFFVRRIVGVSVRDEAAGAVVSRRSESMCSTTGSRVWPRIVLALGVVTALSVCVPL